MVLWCPNKGTINGLSYFRLTRRRHHMWMRALGRDPTIETLNTYNVVCSNHFLESDIITNRAKLYLRENAIPRLKLKKPKIVFTPSRSKRAKEWAITAGREDLLKKVDTLYKGHRICGDHFEKEMFSTPECNRLLAQAKPTIFQHSKPEPEQSITDHPHSLVETKILENILSSQNEDSSMLEETVPLSSGTDDLLLHHEIDIKTVPVSSTNSQTWNSQTQTVLDKQEASMKRQIAYLMNDNCRLIRQIRELDAQVEVKRNQILKTLTMEEFQDILKKFKNSEQQSDSEILKPNESDDVVVKIEAEDVAVKVEDAPEWEDDIVKVENPVKWEDVVVKTESEDVAVKVEYEEVFVKTEDIVKMETD